MVGKVESIQRYVKRAITDRLDEHLAFTDATVDWDNARD